MVNEAMNLTGGTCETPPSLAGVLLGYESRAEDNYFEEQTVTNFTCCKMHAVTSSLVQFLL